MDKNIDILDNKSESKEDEIAEVEQLIKIAEQNIVELKNKVVDGRISGITFIFALLSINMLLRKLHKS